MIQPADPRQDARASADGGDDEQLLPARMLNEYTYCPRLFYLEYVDGLFAHNHDTVEGSLRHARVDRRAESLPPANDEDRPEVVHARSVTLGSARHGIVAELDLVEAVGDLATPVDYKRGSPKLLDDGSLGAWDPERVQLCAQALVLRENGFRCEEGILFFWTTRQRVRVPIDDELVRLTERMIAESRQAMDSPHIPPPLVDSPKCPRCSLVGICLPDETNACRELDQHGKAPPQRLLFDPGPVRLQWPDQAPAASQRPRALLTARDESRPLYLNTQGYTLGKSGEVLQVKDKGKLVQEIRLREVSQVNVMGAVQVTTQAIQTLLQQEIPLLYFTMGGWFYGMTQGVGLKNIIWRREQFRLADNPRFCLHLARSLTAAKIRNQRTLLMRNHFQPPAPALQFLKALLVEVEAAESLASLLGLEGVAARCYFENFAGMIKSAEDDDSAPPTPRFDFRLRNRRPPRDPVNALLSLGYSLLSKDLTVTCASVGLDPYLGYYHQPRFGRPALALDLMEPFRPLIVDSAVLSAINTRMVGPQHFVAAADSVALNAEGRKAFFRAYEQRMDQLVTHPTFGYRVSYRRILEIQTRLLARLLTGEIREYPGFTTR